MAYGLDLQTSQLPCHSLHIESPDLALSLRCPNMEVLGGVSMHKYYPTTQIVSKTMEIHGNFHQPSPWWHVVVEYYSHGLEYYFVAKYE